jgi:transcriptional regulator with XRE-family HTH domain
MSEPTVRAYREMFIARVREARTRRQLTQRGLAVLLGIAQDTYKQYETRSLLPHHLVPKFCLACEVDPVWLFGVTRPRKPSPRREAATAKRPKERERRS